MLYFFNEFTKDFEDATIKDAKYRFAGRLDRLVAGVSAAVQFNVQN
jgi:hypothetical protein